MYRVIVLSFIFSSIASASCMPRTCDKHTYDELYRRIIFETMKSDMKRSDFDIRNESIEKLRRLCNGQVSTYEEGRNEAKRFVP